MAEDWTGLTNPSKRLVKSYKIIYSPDPVPQPIYPSSPPPNRPSTGSSGSTSATGNPFGVAKPAPTPSFKKIASYPPNTFFTISGTGYNSGAGGCDVYLSTTGQVTIFYK